MRSLRKSANILIHILFWSWNAIFLAFVILGFVPLVGVQLIDAVRTGLITWDWLAYGLTVVGIPVFAVGVGVFVRRSPAKLFALGYGVEAPLLLAAAGRIFGVRALMPGVSFLLALATIGILALLWDLLDQRIEARGGVLACLRASGLTVLLLVGLYASIWAAFYALPVLVFAARALADVLSSTINGHGPPLKAIPSMVLGLLLLVFSATLFVVLPVAVPIIYVRHWWRSIRALWARVSRSFAVALPLGVATLAVAGFVWTNQQPQRQAFAMLEKPPASAQEAAALLAQQDTLREGLLNAYLSSYRYASAVGEVRHVSSMYREALRMNPAQADVVEGWYEFVARPFLYEPVLAADAAAVTRVTQQDTSMHNDAARAAELYQRVFDRPINKAELKTITQDVRATWNRDMATTAWQAVDDREILLLRQELNVTEHGDWADVELYEAYQNQTMERQEVVYYFSLPESAVITGLWLGESADRTQRYAFQVAPRGAAQSTYRAELRRNVDPALVEQIGPSQYRLRAFPVEPPHRRWDSTLGRSQIEETPQMHLWMTWRVMAVGAAWPQPHLSEKRNVYWDRSSVRQVNGQPVPGDVQTWLPGVVPAVTTPTPAAHRVQFDDGTVIVAAPAGNPAEVISAFKGLRLAIVVDRSRSMAAHAGSVNTALAALRDLKLSQPVDVYLTAADYSGLTPATVDLVVLSLDQLVYSGGQNPGELLRQFDSLRGGRRYEAILALTDDSGYDMGPDAQKLPPPDAPIWMLHLDGALPMGYGDRTLEAIQSSGGGVATTLDEAIQRIGQAALQQRQSNSAFADIVDTYVWRTLPATEAAALTPTGAKPHTQDDPFAALAARRLILSRMQQYRGNITEVSTLDQLHRVAVRQSIVTPYSSMIVLVNEAQKQRLTQAEKRGDRFDREYEQVGETIPEGTSVMTAVPEPEEWLLIGLALVLLGALAWRERQPRRGAKA